MSFRQFHNSIDEIAESSASVLQQQDEVSHTIKDPYPSTLDGVSLPHGVSIGLQTSAVRAVLPSAHPTLNHFLEGGLRFGELSEWGIPWGKGGYEIMVGFVAAATQRKLWTLWISGSRSYALYPPAWASRGVALDYLRVITCAEPVATLKPLWWEDFFKLIIIDGSCRLESEEYAFLARRARRQQQSIVVVRHQLLHPSRGNVWARLRCNSWRDNLDTPLVVSSVRGLSPRQIALT